MSLTVVSAQSSSEQESPELLGVLTEQHEQLKTLMTRVMSCPVPNRQHAFDQVRSLLATHEAAEMEVIHSMAAKALGANEDVVAQRLAEEDEASLAIAKLEQLDVASEEFVTGFVALQKAVIAHAEAEEHEELPALAGYLDAGQQHEMVVALAQVPEFAQSRTGQPGSFTAMLQAARSHFRQLTKT